MPEMVKLTARPEVIIGAIFRLVIEVRHRENHLDLIAVAEINFSEAPHFRVAKAAMHNRQVRRVAPRAINHRKLATATRPS